MSLKIILSGVIICLLYTFQSASAQSNLLEQDLSKIKVDQLSDAQIKQFINAAEERNLSDQQIETTAVIRGLPRAEVSKLMSRLRSVRLSSGSQAQNNRNGTSGNSLNLQDSANVDSSNNKSAGSAMLTKEERKVFGMELFNNQNITFEPSINIATPKNYQLGTGDELMVNIWGASRQNYILEVSREGTVTIDNLGPIYVNGLTVEEASDRIINRLTDIYSGLRSFGERGPNTFAEVSLGRVRSIKVTIVGEVRKPGTYTLPSLASAFNALYLSGGPSFIGSFRDIEIVRNNKVVAILDIYDYLVKGENASTIPLQDQDIIRVVPYDTRIELQGEVKRSGYYEMKGEESLGEAIRFSGGFTDKAYTHRLKVIRKTDRAKRIEDIDGDEISSFTPQNGDLVKVDSILDRFENRVEIVGAVFRTGTYELKEGMTLKELIQKAEGLREDAFTSRALIYRKGEDLTSKVISVSLRDVLTDRAPDIGLQREDLVRVFSIFDLEEEFNVNINGEVQAPGEFSFMRNMTLEDLIAMAGGLKESASQARVEVARRVTAEEILDQENPNVSENVQMANIFQFYVDKDLSLSPENASFELMPFDQVFVRKSPEYEVQQGVVVKGEVMYPGQYVITNKNERISSLIERAGGLTSFAYLEGARLIRLNPEYYKELNQRKEEVIDSLQRVQISSEMNSSSVNSNASNNARGTRGKGIVNLQTLDPELLKTLAAAKVRVSETNAIGIELQRILESPKSKYDLILLPGDTLEVPKELQTVQMNGQLLYPSSTRYDRSKGFKHYISEAGGFTKRADKKRAYVIYANGSVDKTGSFLFFKDYPEVKPGAEIIVPQKQGGLSTQAWVGIGSTLASIALTIVTVINVANRN
ncbi:protein involved in polysaccharide export with SLBB domain [Catalinimonas alkaloidigena]|uniref:SLBB domain-containing protein n=1 Tax=Catalinimonas alkaloidigena TaxID=1075417 RepID=UPI0024052CF5|nr:SLBB domain-containing protein [Catalinimonas alkaloidigena]MDF9801112.1 protein involved in polysaccharide export with SLBB domain [Catalinimonas alkaloidigena]